MDIVIMPFHITGEVTIPASKSYLQRYIALASVCDKWSCIKNFHHCGDVLSAIDCAKSFKAEVLQDKDTIKIKGIERIHQDKEIVVDAGESGLCARMFGTMLPILFKQITLMGRGTLLKRNMSSLITTLQIMGCEVDAKEAYLPIKIKLLKQNHHIKINHIDSSQVITGLLYASMLMNESTLIEIDTPVSHSYINISIDVAKQFGIDIQYSSDYRTFYIPIPQNISPVNAIAEGDWSNASFFAVAAALSGKIRLKNLNKQSLQGDKIILDVLQMVGAKVEWDNNICIIEKQNLQPFHFDLTHYPDLFPPLVVLATGIKGITKLKGVHRLLNKESNRANALVKEFSNLGAEIKWIENEMIINGKGYLNGGVMHSHDDHRIAMAAAIAATISKKKITLKNAEAVNKSYPQFFDTIKQITECKF